MISKLMAWLRTFRPCECCLLARSHDGTPGTAFCARCDGGHCWHRTGGMGGL